MRTYEQAASEAALDKATDQAAADATVATAGAGTLNRPDAEETPEDPEDIAARSLTAGTMAVLDPADSGLLVTEGGFCTTLDMGICFAAGTPVLMADGTTKPIETLRPGDQVLAAPEHNAESTPAPKTVERVFHNPPSELIKLTIAGTAIRSTPPHLFYVRNNGWTAAQDLQVGAQLRTPDGRWVTLDAIEDQSEPEPVFNFRVADYHTYFVGNPAGGEAVLVHNEYDGELTYDESYTFSPSASDIVNNAGQWHSVDVTVIKTKYFQVYSQWYLKDILRSVSEFYHQYGIQIHWRVMVTDGTDPNLQTLQIDHAKPVMSQEDVVWYYEHFEDKPTVFLIDYIDMDNAGWWGDPAGLTSDFGGSFAWVADRLLFRMDEKTIVHELGHMFGVHHTRASENLPGNIMDPAPFGKLKGKTLEPGQVQIMRKSQNVKPIPDPVSRTPFWDNTEFEWWHHGG